MKTKITMLVLALFAMLGVNATTPSTWSITSNGSASEVGDVVWGDFNNDGYLDMFQVSVNVHALYKNNGDETFTNVSSAKLPASIPSGLGQSMAIALDYNNDGNLDLLVSGYNGSTSVATLYKNSGAPDYTFAVDETNNLLGVRTGDNNDSHKFLSATDYNNDGWVDLFMEGYCDGLGTRVVTLYKNVAGTFVRQTTPVGGTADFEGMSGGSLHTGDVNHDGYVDMICSGYSVIDAYRTYLYINQGNGTFVKSSASFPGVEKGQAFLFDSNNDGWLDVYVAGVGHDGSNWVWPGNLYLNNQDGTFTLTENTNLPSGTEGYAAMASGDVNNDGKTDLMVMLPNGDNTAIFYNNGDNTYLKDVLPVANRARSGSLDLADYNNDNKLDYFLFGYNDNISWLGVFVKNTLTVVNSAPSTPANVSKTNVNGKYVISWDKSTDDITPQDAIRYNVYVQDQTGKVYVYSPADITTGRLKSASQTLLNKNEITLDLADGQYTIGVQAIDQANVASAFFSTGLSIITGTENAMISKINVHSIKNNIVIENNGSQRANVMLMSLNGQLLYKGFSNSGSKTVIPISLNQGVYLVKLFQDNTSAHTVKVTVW